jgi:hypothetical protein
MDVRDGNLSTFDFTLSQDDVQIVSSVRLLRQEEAQPQDDDMHSTRDLRRRSGCGVTVTTAEARPSIGVAFLHRQHDLWLDERGRVHSHGDHIVHTTCELGFIHQICIIARKVRPNHNPHVGLHK